MTENELFHEWELPQLYEGRIVEKMPQLIKKQVPANVLSIMMRRLDDSLPFYRDNYFHVGDGFVFPRKGDYSDGRFKVRRNSEGLRTLTQESKFIQGGLIIPSYEEIDAPEFKRNDFILGRDLTRKEAKEHGIWFEVLGKNPAFLNSVVDKVFDVGKQRYNYNEMMGIYLPDELEQPHERAAGVDRLGGRSLLSCRYVLHYFGGRLVGLAPEALSALEKTATAYPDLETAIRIVNQHVSEVELRKR